MKNFNFPSFQEEVALVDFTPKKMLQGYETFFDDDQFKSMSIEEKLPLIVLDRDGHFFSEIKPSPKLLILLKMHHIFVEAFVFYNGTKRIYACFLKKFIEKSDIKNYKEFFNK